MRCQPKYAPTWAEGEELRQEKQQLSPEVAFSKLLSDARHAAYERKHEEFLRRNKWWKLLGKFVVYLYEMGCVYYCTLTLLDKIAHYFHK